MNKVRDCIVDALAWLLLGIINLFRPERLAKKIAILLVLAVSTCPTWIVLALAGFQEIWRLLTFSPDRVALSAVYAAVQALLLVMGWKWLRFVLRP